jgi:long-chain acyl-CoA synthetase
MVAGGKYALKPVYPEFPTIVHALDEAARAVPAATGLIVGERRLTYRQYRNAVAGFARRLRELGAQGRRVGVLMPNAMETVVAHFGIMAARAQTAPFNPMYTDTELVPLIRSVMPHVLVADAAFAERARRLAAEIGIPHVEILGAGGTPIEPWANDPAMTLPTPLPEPADPCAMFFTGGTTGVPKGAEHRHASIMAYVYGTCAIWPLPIGTERILSVAPLFHIWGYCFCLVAPVYLRALMVLEPVFKPAILLDSFARHRITMFAGGPAAFFVGLIGNENFARTDFSNLKVSLSGGAPCPEELIRKWESLTRSILCEGLGMSEGAPIAGNPVEGPRKPLSVGPLPPGTEVEIVDLESGTRTMPQGERGEIRVRGPQFAFGYCNRPEETAQAFRDGWLYTGDIGYFDADDYLFVVDRKKEMILVGGYNVYPREIDELLYRHPAIHEAATVGVPDAFSGEAVKCYVALKPGAALAREALEAYCEQHLVKYKRPKHIEFLEALPKTGVGKINKLALKARR